MAVNEAAEPPTPTAESESDVLQAFVEDPDEFLSHKEVVARSGYGLNTVKSAIARLKKRGWLRAPNHAEKIRGARGVRLQEGCMPNH